MAEIPKSIKATLYIDGKPAESSLKNIKAVTQTLNRDLEKLVVGTDAWNRKMKELQQHRKVLADINSEIKETNGLFGFLKTEIGKMGALAAGYLGFQFVTDQFRDIIMSNAKLSDSMADVRKTTGMSEEAVRGLNNELKKIDTRTSRQELLGLAEVAGKLGITGKEDVLGFIKAADQINVALGKDLGNAEQAVNDLGKLADLFKLKDQFGLEEALLKSGSAINELGAAGTANEGYIVEFTKRLGTIAPAAHISIENIMGLAATMDELGQPVESAATALSQFIVGMGKDLPTYAKVAEMSVKDFSDLLQKDGNAALIAVLEKLKNTGGGVAELASKMGLIGEEGARATAALGALSGSLDKLKERQALSNKEFDKGTSLTREFAVKNENFASILDKIGKWFYGLATSNVVTSVLTSAANGFARLIGVTQTSSEKIDAERLELNKLALQITSTNTKHEDRIKLINQLKDKYPALLKNLDAERASNYEVAKAIKAVNDQLINKSILAKKDQEIEEENEKTAKLKMKLLESEDKIRERLVKLNEKFPQFKLPEGTDAEKLTSLLNQYNKLMASQGKTTGGAFDPTFGAAKLVNEYNVLSSFLEDSNNKTGKLINKRNELMTRLGIKDLPTTGTGNSKVVNTEGDFVPGPTKSEASEAESARKKAIAEFESLNSEYKKLGLERLNDQLSKNEKEIAQEEQKYNSLINKEKEFLKQKGVTSEQRKAITDQITSLEQEKETSVANLRIRQEAAVTAQINELRVSMSNVHESELQKQKDQIDNFYDALERDNAGNEKVLAQLKIDRAKDISNAEIREKQRLEDEKLKIDSQSDLILGIRHDRKIAQINKQYDDEILALRQKFSSELHETEAFYEALRAIEKNRKAAVDLEEAAERDQKKQYAIELAQIISSATFSIMANNRRAESEAKISQLEQDRNQELSNKNLTEAQKKSINDKYDKKIKEEKLRSWKADQRAAAAQAIINGALAVTKALPNFILAGIAGAAAAAQLAVILAEKPPKFAQGGMSDQDPAGYVSQPTLFNRSASGRRFIAGEAGREWIAPNWMLQSPRYANIIGMLETARQEKRTFAAGGSTSDPVEVPAPVDNSELTGLIRELIVAQKQANDKKVVMVYKDLEEFQNKITEIRNSSAA